MEEQKRLEKALLESIERESDKVPSEDWGYVPQMSKALIDLWRLEQDKYTNVKSTFGEVFYVIVIICAWEIVKLIL